MTDRTGKNAIESGWPDLGSSPAETCIDAEGLRRQQQLAFDASGVDISFGSLQPVGLDLPQLKQIKADSSHVVGVFTDGLTAEVFHLQTGDKEWNLKLKRSESLVKNVDGQTSFLNEVQRRRDFIQLKAKSSSEQNILAQTALSHIVDTQFASYREGVLLSPWIDGERLHKFNESILQQLFATLVQMELSGLMEWDLCAGNILFDGENVFLFDFGYCYPFDPLRQFNSSGLSAPMFHSVERLETRNFFGYLLQKEVVWSDRAILSLFDLEKRLAIEAYQYKYAQLKSRGASETVLAWQRDILNQWQQAITGESSMEQLFLLESYRSHVLDIHDDISGQSCTPLTLKRLSKVETILRESYGMLLRNNGLFFGDEQRTKSALLAKVAAQRDMAEQYQLNSPRR